MPVPAGGTAWPPLLDALKLDQGVAATDTRDDDKLQQVLTAAIAVVERLREGELNFTGDPDSDLPGPDHGVVVGTIRLAYRWHVRRRSPDALVAMAELGSARVPSFDPDIEMMLRVGRSRDSFSASPVPLPTWVV